MVRAWVLGFLLPLTVFIAGCAEQAEDPDATTTTGTDGNGHPPGHMENGTGELVEMYAVATDLSSTPETWFRFRPGSFSAKVGDQLNITIKSAVGNQYPHSLVIDALDVDLGPVQAGAQENTVIEVTQAGTFTFYCSEGNHEQLGMRGTLTVS